jgi:hypothetical protein
MEQELCPICIEKPAENYTECNHSFCISCLCRIKKCAICRKSLLKFELCREIKFTFERKIKQISETDSSDEISTISSVSTMSIFDEEYIDYDRTVNQLEEYVPIISHSNQFPSDTTSLFDITPTTEDTSNVQRLNSMLNFNNLYISHTPMPSNRQMDWYWLNIA